MNHREIIELLPWYANQTLAEDERKIVERHVAECAECAEEVKSLSAMRKAVTTVGDARPALPAFALNRALAQIEDYECTKAEATSPTREQTTSFWSRWWKPTPVFARALIAVQIVLVLALGSVTLYQHAHPKVIYSYLTSSGAEGDRSSTKIMVGFAETASEQEIRQTILAIKGQIVDGPDALGLYTIRVAIPRERTAEIDRVLEILQQNQKVVRFAAEKL